uniref:Amine oxidase domain-containing protein n=1 Tax=Aegilops tauschii subsp. strangulata TaxID=200361 RepID=A0A453SEP3_AEGTS
MAKLKRPRIHGAGPGSDDVSYLIDSARRMQAPVGGRVYFTGEHTSEHYNGYVHGAYLAGIDSADILMNKVLNNVEFKVRPKYDEEQKAEAK